MPLPARLRPHLPFAIVAALFLFQGLALWGLVQWDPIRDQWFHDAVYSWVAGIACSWNVWLMLHAGRGWRPWLEGLTLAGATYWIPLAYVFWLMSLPRPEPTGFIVIELDRVVLVFLVAAVLEVALVGIVLLVARWTTGWRLVHAQAATAPSQLSLRGMLLLIAVLAGHLFFLRFLLRESLTWDWINWREWAVTNIAIFLAWRAVPTVLVHLALLRLVLARPTLNLTTPVLLILGILSWWLATRWTEPPPGDNPFKVTFIVSANIAAQALVFGGVMRWAGYRLETRRERAERLQQT